MKWAPALLLLILFYSSPARAIDVSNILNFQAGYNTDSNVYRDANPSDRESD